MKPLVVDAADRTALPTATNKTQQAEKRQQHTLEDCTMTSQLLLQFGLCRVDDPKDAESDGPCEHDYRSDA
jgi:hypothetical protein